MPASRRDAATTLAPRSWPSSPGLPTSTRILRSMHPLNPDSSERVRRLVILTKHAPQLADDPPFRAVAVGAADQVRHQVFRSRRRTLEIGERSIGVGRASLRPQAP